MILYNRGIGAILAAIMIGGHRGVHRRKAHIFGVKQDRRWGKAQAGESGLVALAVRSRLLRVHVQARGTRTSARDHGSYLRSLASSSAMRSFCASTSTDNLVIRAFASVIVVIFRVARVTGETSY